MKFADKKFFYVAVLLIVCKLMMFNPGVAQIIITNSDMPSPGDTIRKSQTTDLFGTDYTLTGENYYWDFSFLEPVVQTIDTFASVTSVPFLYQLVFIPNIVANLAQKFSEIDTIPELPVTDPYRFFLKNSASYKDVGYAITVSGIPVPLRLNPADVVYKFPLAYGNVDSSDASGQIGLPGFGFIGIERKRVNTVDGWGTLATPFGSFDVIRLKSEVFETDSIFIDTLNFGTTLERNYIEYKWMANGIKAPVLQVTAEGPILQVAYVDSIQGTTVNVAEKTAFKPTISTSPNPASDHTLITIELASSSEVTISLLNLSGAVVYNLYEGFLPFGRHFFPLNVSAANLDKGIYLVKLQSNSAITTLKIIIQ
jgi:hypothetical protein